MNQRPPSAARLVWLDDLRRDIVHAVRTLTRAPAFTAVAMLTLALGIGAVTVSYSVVYNGAVAPPRTTTANRRLFVQFDGCVELVIAARAPRRG